MGQTSQLSRREESSDLHGSHQESSEPKSESERYAVLAKQDLARAIHPSIVSLLVDGQLASTSIPTAKKDWGRAHNMRFGAGANLKDLEGYFQLTVLLAPYMEVFETNRDPSPLG